MFFDFSCYVSCHILLIVFRFALQSIFKFILFRRFIDDFPIFIIVYQNMFYQNYGIYLLGHLPEHQIDYLIYSQCFHKLGFLFLSFIGCLAGRFVACFVGCLAWLLASLFSGSFVGTFGKCFCQVFSACSFGKCFACLFCESFL